MFPQRQTRVRPLQRTAYFLCLLAAVVACGKIKSDADDLTLNPFLTNEEMAPAASASKLESAGLASFLTDHVGLLQANAPTTTNTSDDCVDQRIGALTVQAAEDTYGVNATIDLAPCLQDDNSDSDVTVAVETALVQVLSRTRCPGHDFTEHNGKKLLQIENLCVGASRLTSLRQRRLLTRVTASSLDAQNTLVQVTSETRSIEAEMGADESACGRTLVSDHYEYDSACVFVEREQSVETNSAAASINTQDHSVRFTVKEALKRHATSTQPWFASGVLAALVNNWNGTFTYSSPSASPTYSLSNGTETIDGTLVAPALQGDLDLKLSLTSLSRRLSATTKHDMYKLKERIRQAKNSAKNPWKHRQWPQKSH